MFMIKYAKAMTFIAFIFFTGCGATSAKGDAEKMYFSVLDAQLKALETGDYHTMDRVFDLRRIGKESTTYLVDLLDYDLGAGASETLWEFIVEGGDIFVEKLKAKRARGLECLERYSSICVENIQERNRRIDELLSMISNNRSIDKK